MEIKEKHQKNIVFDTLLVPDSSEELSGLLMLASQISKASTAIILMNVNDQKEIIAKWGNISGHSQIPNFNSDETIISNTLNDKRFDKVKINHQKISSFAAFNLPVPDQASYMNLCVMDSEIIEFTAEQIQSLKIISYQLAKVLKIRNFNFQNNKTSQQLVFINEALNDIFKNFYDAVIIVNPSGIIEDCNPVAEELFGWTKGEMKGKLFHTLLLSPSFYKQHLQILKKFADINNKNSFHNTYVEISAKDKFKSEIHISLAISSVEIKNSNFLICTIKNISDRNIITEKLDRQKEFYEKILNTLPTDIAVFDPDHKYLFVNPGAISVEEYRKFIIGKDDYQYAAFRNRPKSSADGRRAKFLEVKNHGKEIRWEDTLPDPNGYMITHLRRMYPVHDEDGKLTMVIGFGVDITDRKLMEEKQSLLVDQLSAQNVQLIDFCNIVSHNLRAPLVNLGMLVELIEKSQDVDKRAKLISKLKPVIGVLDSTFSELVESIQIKQDLEIKSEWIDLETCLSRTMRILDLEINLTEATIESNFSDAPEIYFPPKYLYSIFQNFLSNSLKYQSPVRKLKVKFESKNLPENKILFSVSDNGLGIDLVKHKDNIFKIGKIFHHHKDARGFGLFMTKSQLDAMNNKIWVESELNVGTTFFIEFSNKPL